MTGRKRTGAGLPHLPRLRLVQAGRYPSAGFGLDGFPPLMGAGLDRVAFATRKH